MIGKGEIDLGYDVNKAYVKYLDSKPTAFAVTTDGKTSWGYYYCESIRCRETKAQAMYSAIKLCEQYSNGMSCKIYAIGQDVVWKTNTSPNSLSEMSYSAADKKISGYDDITIKDIPLATRECSGGFGECMGLGHKYKNGEGVPKDLEKAAAYYKQACDVNYARGCVNLAKMFEKGSGVKQSRKSAEILMERACKGGYSKACQ